MCATQHDDEQPCPDDSGFSLVEVIWAMFLLGIVAMGSLMLFLNGIGTISDFQRQQAAATLASSAMDRARSVKGGTVDGSGVPGILKGRSASDVNAAWVQAAPIDIDDMTPASDPSSGTTTEQWVPIRDEARVDNQDYVIYTHIGHCHRLRVASTAEQDCLVGKAPDETYMDLFRVRVVVTWDGGQGGSGENVFRMTSLIDPSEDPQWNTVVTPFAYETRFNVPAGGEVTPHELVENESMKIFGTTQPSHGSVNISGNRTVDVTSPPDVFGPVTFDYTVHDGSGHASDPGTVTINVLPTPVRDDFEVPAGSLTDLNDLLLGNDHGVAHIADAARVPVIQATADTDVDWFTEEGATSTPVDMANLASMGITVDSGQWRYQAPDSVGTDVAFYYYLFDSNDDERQSTGEWAKVTITTTAAAISGPDGTGDLLDEHAGASRW